MSDELETMAAEELDAACAMPFADIRKITPWGDTSPGFRRGGGGVGVPRRYLWAHEPEGGVIVEVEVHDPETRTGHEARALLTEPRSE